MPYSIFADTLADMKWPQVQQAVDAGAIVLTATGTVEEHGPHMGLGTDTYLALHTARMVCAELQARGIPAVIAPPVYWGISDIMSMVPGTFTVRAETLKALVYDLLAALHRWGFRRVFNVNGHGERAHILAIIDGFREANAALGLDARYILERYELRRLGLSGNEPYLLITDPPPDLLPPSEFLDIHAGEMETAAMVAYFPEQVDTEVAHGLPPTNLTFDDLRVWVRGGEPAQALTPLGYFGAPAAFDGQDARRYFQTLTRVYADAILSPAL